MPQELSIKWWAGLSNSRRLPLSISIGNTARTFFTSVLLFLFLENSISPIKKEKKLERYFFFLIKGKLNKEKNLSNTSFRKLLIPSNYVEPNSGKSVPLLLRRGLRSVRIPGRHVWGNFGTYFKVSLFFFQIICSSVSLCCEKVPSIQNW